MTFMYFLTLTCIYLMLKNQRLEFAHHEMKVDHKDYSIWLFLHRYYSESLSYYL